MELICNTELVEKKYFLTHIKFIEEGVERKKKEIFNEHFICFFFICIPAVYYLELLVCP